MITTTQPDRPKPVKIGDIESPLLDIENGLNALVMATADMADEGEQIGIRFIAWATLAHVKAAQTIFDQLFAMAHADAR